MGLGFYGSLGGLASATGKESWRRRTEDAATAAQTARRSEKKVSYEDQVLSYAKKGLLNRLAKEISSFSAIPAASKQKGQYSTLEQNNVLAAVAAADKVYVTLQEMCLLPREPTALPTKKAFEQQTPEQRETSAAAAYPGCLAEQPYLFTALQDIEKLLAPVAYNGSKNLAEYARGFRLHVEENGLVHLIATPAGNLPPGAQKAESEAWVAQQGAYLKALLTQRSDGSVGLLPALNALFARLGSAVKNEQRLALQAATAADIKSREVVVATKTKKKEIKAQAARIKMMQRQFQQWQKSLREMFKALSAAR
ncbi:MAG: hypothetical protein LBJ38_01760 [Oscillospiraceae bacterium]|nr:hypothetical protein [Oscillospiraceae bacterium]